MLHCDARKISIQNACTGRTLSVAQDSSMSVRGERGGIQHNSPLSGGGPSFGPPTGA